MELQKLWVSLQLKADDFGQGLDEARKRAEGFADRVRGSVSGALGTVATVGRTAFLGVGAAAVGGFGMALGAAIDMNASLEASTLQFTTLMGDADTATAHVASLFEFAAKTPYESQQIIDASLKLQTFGGEALNTMDNLTLVGDAAAAVGAPIDEVSFWVGRLYSNLQAGAPFGEAAARLQELGIMGPEARTQLEGMQAAGVGANEIFATFQGQLGNFTGAMELQAGTWGGLMSTIKDNLQMAAADGLRPFFDLAKEGLEGLATWLASPEVQAGIQNLSARLTELIQGVATFVTEQVIPFVQQHGPMLKGILIALATAFGALLVVGAVTTAIAALTNPITLVVVAVGALGAAWSQNWGGIRDKTEAVINFIRPLVENAIAAIRGWWDENGAAILAGVRWVWDSVREIISGVITLVSLIIQKAVALIQEIWKRWGDDIMAVIRFAWDTVKTIIGTAIENIKLVIGAFIDLFTGDWEGFKEKIGEIWQNTWDAVVSILGNLWGLIQPKLLEIWDNLKGWFDGKVEDFKQLGRDVINGIINGLDEVGDKIRQTLVDWATKAWDSVKEFFGISSPATKGKDAGRNIGEGLIEGVLDSGADFWDRTERVFDDYYGQIEEWYTSRPWAELVEYSTEVWEETLTQLWPVTGPRFEEWYGALTEWWTARAWEEMPEHTIGVFAARFGTMSARLAPAYEDFFQTSILVFRAQDWAIIGSQIVDGVVHGVNSNAGKLEAAMRDIARRAKAAADKELEAASPARVMIPTGQAIVQGIIVGIERERPALILGLEQLVYDIGGILAAAGTAGSIGGGFQREFERQVVNPLEGQLAGLEGTIKDLMPGLAEAFETWTGAELPDWMDPTMYGTVRHELSRLRQEAWGTRQWGLFDDASDALRALERRNELSEEYARQQERILALQKAQADLDFLKTQLDLLKLIQENGIDASILEGLQLGLGADAGALMDTMVDVMERLVQTAQHELQIGSPSHVAREMGRQWNAGLAEGLEELAVVERAVDRAMNAVPAALRGAELSGGGGTTDNSRRTAIYGGYHVTVETARDSWLEEQEVLSR